MRWEETVNKRRCLPRGENRIFSLRRAARWTLLVMLTAGIVVTTKQVAFSQTTSPSLPQSEDQSKASAQSQGGTQSQAQEMTVAIQELQQQVRELRSVVADVRSQAEQYRAETEALRKELRASAGHNSMDTAAPQASIADERGSATAEQRVNTEDDTTLLNRKIDEQQQIKVESASKYRVRLSGIVLMNMFSNRGAVDNLDVPIYAAPSSASTVKSLGATLRQSELGLEVFGPQLFGAKTSGEVQFDFSGGFPNTPDGVNYGLVRLRTGSMRMDWSDTSVVAGQDGLFFSPLSPTSFASLAVPAFAYAGNLWGWIPQVRVEHRFQVGQTQKITIQAGVLDNLAGEPPYVPFDRQSQPGEATAQPAYAARTSWSSTLHDRPLTIGVAGFYGRQDWGSGRRIDGWAGLADWSFPIIPRWILSGEFYRGRAIGALGGAIGQSVLFGGNPTNPSTRIQALQSIGGWSQLKYTPISKLEFNGAFGLDNPLARDLHVFNGGIGIYGSALAQNRSGLLNFVFRPRSNLLFSAEYRHLHTLEIYGATNTAEQFNVSTGIMF